MASNGSASFERHFQDLADPRIERARKHPLINIIFMAVCGVLSGSDSIAGIHEFAVDRRNWFARYLDLSQGVPCEDTFARVLARIDPAAFEKCLLSWIEAVHQATDHRLIAIDGKTLRGSAGSPLGGAHCVGIHASEREVQAGEIGDRYCRRIHGLQHGAANLRRVRELVMSQQLEPRTKSSPLNTHQRDIDAVG